MVALQTTLSPLKLKKLLKTPSPTASAPPSPTKTKALLSNHLIYEIARYCDLREILHLSLCTHRLRTALAPLLYARVELKTNRHCKATLLSLSKRPDYAQHVRHLVIRVNNPEWTDRGDDIDERIIASIIAKMATAGSLKSLRFFEWDGLEMPIDELWLSLKLSCLKLKRIRTTVGEEALKPSSPLWEFNDLRQFGLTVKCHSLYWLFVDGLPKPEKLPKQLWAMLLERSPRLEELTLGGPAPSPRIFDIRHVTSGRWPRLRSVTLGDMMLIPSDKCGDVEATKAFHAFFAFHRELRHVGLEHGRGSAFFPGAFEFGSRDGSPHLLESLPKLESFSGSLKYVKTLPSKVRRQLKSLRLTSLHHSLSGVAPTVNILRDLHSLEELSVWVALSFGANSLAGSARRSSIDGMGIGRSSEQSSVNDDEKVLGAVLDACPDGLRHLDVACFTRPGLSIKEFSAALLHAPPSMTSFNLTKVYKSGEEDLTRSAARIVTENPNLRKFTLRMTQDPWFSASGSCGRVRAMGSYEVVAEIEDLDCDVREESVRDITADSYFASSPATSSPPTSPLSPLQEVEFIQDFQAHGLPPLHDSAQLAEVPARICPDSPIDTIHPFPLFNSFSSPAQPSLSTPTSLIAHEWGQKSLSLMSKEFTRHFVYRLTEKEVEACRVQIKDVVRKRRLFDVPIVVAANNGPISSVSRSSSGSSAGSLNRQSYGYSYEQRQLMSASLSSFGTLRPRKGHRHSSSMSSVMRPTGGFQNPYYNMPGSMLYRNNSVAWADKPGTSFGRRSDELVRITGRDTAVPDYILV